MDGERSRMNKMQFLLNGNVHPSSVMPAIATALAAQSDSTAVRADYSLLISAFDFVCALRDIARVGREAIVSFPNFAYWPHRMALLRGRMPVSKLLPYEWYDTPNLRCATIKDFEELANQVGGR